MKIVTAIIKPMKLDAVTEALTAMGVGGMTVQEVKGFGQQRGHVDRTHFTEITQSPRSVANDSAVQFLSKIRLDVAVKDEMVEQVMEAIISSAHTGRVGDGKIFVTDLPQVVRIRNRETGDAAL
jgi:nitrogen regulatory protein P-II 2